jgi:PAS domain S-box-containing protein
MQRINTRSGKLVGGIAGFCVILIILIWANHLRQMNTDRKDTIALAERRNSNLAVALEQYAIRTVHNADAVLQLVEMEYDRQGEKISIEKLLFNHAISNDIFKGIGIINEQGRLVQLNINFHSDTLLNFLDRDYFAYHLKNKDEKLFISKPVLSKTIGKPVIVLSRRINKKDGSFGGVVALQIEPSTFTSFYAQANLRTNDIISLISPDGITYARRTGAVESSGEDIIKSPLFKHVAQNPDSFYVAKDAIHGILTYFSYRKIKEYPIIATVGTSQQDVFENYYKRAERDRDSAIVISSLIILFSALLCLVLLHRKKNVEKIRESEIKYRSIFENSQDAILLMKPGGQMLAANSAACRFFGMPEAKLLDKNFLELIDSSDPQFGHLIENGLLGTTDKTEFNFLRSDGSSFVGEMASTLHKDALDNERAIIIIRDVTERKRLTKKLLEEQKRFQRKVTEQVIWAQEKEREVIGRELHDNVNQVLTTVKLYLETALHCKESREELLPKSMHLVMASINEIRNLSRDLSAPTLGTKSLTDSITALVEMVASSSGLSIAFDHCSYYTPLSMNQRLAIYRIVQEQLNNIIKHASATSVSVSLSQTDGDTILIVNDNGKGFDTLGKRNGIGLNNIISRAKVFNGKVKIESAPGKGCLLIVNLPIIAESKEEIAVSN